MPASACRLFLVLTSLTALVAGGCLSDLEKDVNNLVKYPSIENCTSKMMHADAGVRLLATHLLSKKSEPGPTGLKALVEALSDRDPAVRMTALTSLASLKGEAKEAAPYILDRLADPVEAIQMQAMTAVANVAPGDPTALRLIFSRLADAEAPYAVRMEAVIALGRMAPMAGFKVAKYGEKLEEWLGRLDPRMAAAAFYLSMRAAGETGRIVRFFMSRIKDESPAIRRMSARLLGELDRKAKATTPDLVALLSDPDESVRAAAAEALGRIRFSADEAVPPLLSLLVDEDTLFLSTTLKVAEALVAFGEKTVPFLVKKLDSLDYHDRFWAMIVLGEIGTDASEATPAIRRLVQSRFEDKDVILAGEIALSRIQRIK